MLESLKWVHAKQNQSPGSLTYAGKEYTFEPKACLLSYNADTCKETCLDEDAKFFTFPDDKTNLLTIAGVHHAELLQKLKQRVDIPLLFLEDVMNTTQRPTSHWESGSLFIILKGAHFDQNTLTITMHQYCIYFLPQHRVIAFSETEKQPWEAVLHRIRTGSGRIRQKSGGYLVVSLVDTIVDHFFTLLSDLSAKAEELEARLEQKVTEDTLLDLYKLKRNVVLLNNIFIPTREILEELGRPDSPAFSEEVRPYLLDVKDHAFQVAESAQALHEIIRGMLDVQISLVGMRMNQIMKLLTLIATIFIPLTFISGVYGMNFVDMPELHWKFGYPMVLGLMMLVAGGMLLYFKRNKWL